jgi:hypothetical protein
VPKYEIFDPFFKSINPIWVGDLRAGEFFFFSKTTADICHFVFFAHAECALKNFLRRLSVRKKKLSKQGINLRTLSLH